MRSWGMGKIWHLSLILSLVLVSQGMGPVSADGPDYAEPGRFALPWACGEGQRISWGPIEHWEAGKARGIAFDFAIDEGTPLYAPCHGVAYFLLDERPFETNFGNYVEVASEDGNWLVRLAHLRDAQSGEHPVRAGELIGYAGSSGVTAAHLHLELLVRQGRDWVRPDMASLERFFGWPMTDFAESAIITNDGCAAEAALEGPVRSVGQSAPLGETAQLLIPMRNEGLEPLEIDAVQLFLLHSSGAALVLDAHGAWRLGAKSGLEMVISGRPNLAGRWRIAHLIYTTGSASHRLAASGELSVEPLPLVISDTIVESRSLSVGDPITFEVALRNDGERDIVFDDLIIRGARPDETLWDASYGQPGIVPAQETALFQLTSTIVPQSVGLWRTLQMGLSVDGHILWFAQFDDSFAVSGPQLHVDQAEVYPSDRSLTVVLKLTNVGTHVAMPDAVEVWGWQPDGNTPFTASQPRLAPLGPGATAIVLLTIPLDGMHDQWRLVEAGHWTAGAYYRMPLPHQPGISVLPQGLAASMDP
jgi:murein DD-endopeptidase MepM/ murein hydrolase activator NlpD